MQAGDRGRGGSEDVSSERGWTPPIEQLFPELHTILAENVRRLEGGEGGLVVVAGEPGVGKVWALEAARTLHHGAALIGRASTATHDIPLWPLHQTLASRSEVERPAGGRGSVEEINAVVDAIADLGRQEPTVLGLHRLDVADPATLAVLEALASEVSGVLCVATFRTEPSTPSHEFVDSLLEGDLAVRVDLSPVDDDAVREVVVSLLSGRVVPEELVSRVVYLAGGLPRLAERIVRSAQRRGVLRGIDGEWVLTGTLDDALPFEAVSHVDRALVATGGAERDVSITAAVLGSASITDLVNVTALQLDVLDDATRHAVDLGLLRRVGESVVPRTGLVRDAVLHALIARTDTDVLDRLVAAASFAGSHSHGFDRAVEMLERVGLVGAAANYRLRMASRSMDEGRLRAVEEQLDAVQLDEASTADHIVHASLRLRAAAQAGATSSDTEASWQHLTTALPEVASTADVLLVRALAWTNLEDALARAATMPRRDGAADAFVDSWLHFLRALREDAPNRVRAIEQGTATWTGSADVSCAALRHLSALRSGDQPSETLANLDRARLLAHDGASVIELRRAAAAYAQLELLRGSAPLALNSAARTMCDDGDRVVGGAFLVEASLALAWMGKTTRAANQLVEVFQSARGVSPAISARALVARAGVAAVEGKTDDIEQLLAAAAQLAPEQLGHAAGVRTMAALVRDDLQAAGEAWSAPETDPGIAGVAETQWSWIERMIPLLELVIGTSPSAPRARWAWTDVAGGWDAITRAAVLGAAGDPDGALRELVAGDEALSPFPVQQLFARRLVCELAIRDGWAGRTVELALRASLARCAGTGLDELETRCRTLLRAGGFAVPRYGDGIGEVPIDLRSKGITTREMEVVRLLAGGATTADAAKALFISDATIKSHVSNAMRKLGYSSREELLDALAFDATE